MVLEIPWHGRGWKCMCRRRPSTWRNLYESEYCILFFFNLIENIWQAQLKDCCGVTNVIDGSSRPNERKSSSSPKDCWDITNVIEGSSRQGSGFEGCWRSRSRRAGEYSNDFWRSFFAVSVYQADGRLSGIFLFDVLDADKSRLEVTLWQGGHL